jgi:hypothetical protein
MAARTERIARSLSCPGPIRRREVLKAGALGFFGLSWPGLLRAQGYPSTEGTQAGAGANVRAKACILIYLDGGMSHVDTFDMKPQAPVEYRGEFETIPTSVPGTHVCEHLPQVARTAHRFAMVRSMGQRGRAVIGDNHHTGAYYYLTGSEPDASFGRLRLNRTPQPDDQPFLGAVVAYKRRGRDRMPPLVALPDKAHSAQYIRAGQFGGRIGAEYDPLWVQGNKDRPDEFTVPALELPAELSLSRLGSRRELLGQLDGLSARADQAALAEYDTHQARAFSLLESAGRSGAFDLSEEPDAVRDRYGRDVNGQSILMARRLVEAGVPFVSVFWQAKRNNEEKCYGWDTHANNFHCLKTYLLPYLDRSYSALLDDLHERGLLDETLVVLMSEMGRTPKVGDPRPGGHNGRAHWVHCQTVMLAGAGARGGLVHGASDKVSAYPVQNAVGPENLAATIYDAMGITDLTALTRDGRQFNLVEHGEPMHELFG